MLPVEIFLIRTHGVYTIFVTFSIDFCLKSSLSAHFYFYGHSIPGFPSTFIGFYAVLPIGVYRIRIQEVYSLCVFACISAESS